MPCVERLALTAGPRRQHGAVVLLASAFIFLLSYIALSAVDLAAVEAKLAGALHQQATTRSLMRGAARVVVARETARLQAALAQGDLSACETAAFCDGTSSALPLGDGASYRVTYTTRLAGPTLARGSQRRVQAAVSSHVLYRTAQVEIDISVVRAADSATLARAAVGLVVSAMRPEEES